MNATDRNSAGPNATGPTRLPERRRGWVVASLAPVAVLASLAVVTGCATATPAATPAAAGIATKIAVPASVPTKDLAGLTLNVGDQKAGLEALLKAAGELEDVPYTIKWSTFTSGPPLLEAVNAAVDVGEVGSTPPIFSAAAGGKIAIISASRDSAAGDAVLVPRGSTVKTFADLKGKRVAVAKGSSAHGNLLLQLTKVGPVPSDVQTTFIAPSDAYAALAATLTPQLAASEQSLADAFANAKVIPSRPAIAQIIDSRYNQTVTAQGATS
jgi:ABC-type nitrate/sulfonate/bicarbonate transport system substrate-binding protein